MLSVGSFRRRRLRQEDLPNSSYPAQPERERAYYRAHSVASVPLLTLLSFARSIYLSLPGIPECSFT
jgi:hypothetical protein